MMAETFGTATKAGHVGEVRATSEKPQAVCQPVSPTTSSSLQKLDACGLQERQPDNDNDNNNNNNNLFAKTGFLDCSLQVAPSLCWVASAGSSLPSRDVSWDSLI